jgi:oxalate decarboxylase/phosphoglucose isomerase-like protein (cupin superfamily)
MALLYRRAGADGRIRSVRQARTFDFMAGDVGFGPFAMEHYVENTGTTPLSFLEYSRAAITPTSRSTNGSR